MVRDWVIQKIVESNKRWLSERVNEITSRAMEDCRMFEEGVSMTNRPNFKAPEVDGFTLYPMADCPHCAFVGKVVHLTGNKGESCYCQECGSHFLQYVPIKSDGTPHLARPF